MAVLTFYESIIVHAMINQEIDPEKFGSFSHYAGSLGVTIVINCFIAFFLNVVGYLEPFSISFLFSQVMGLSICTCIHVLLYLVRPRSYPVLYSTVGVGVVCGILIAVALLWLSLGKPFNLVLLSQTLFVGMSFGTVISLFFIFQRQLSATRTRLQEERIKALENEKNVLQTRLRLLQARIEPHFLFNTLANIEGLLADNTAIAQAMLANLTFYLRTSLKKSRMTSVSLEEDLEMIQAYLDIFRIRMGRRLQYFIENNVREDTVSIPPMLLQPLVENSIRHGLEAKPDGGVISVAANHHGNMIRLEVTDTGLGLNGNVQQGIGLANVRERLLLYYGGKADMRIEENRPSGVRVTIEVPCDLQPS